MEYAAIAIVVTLVIALLAVYRLLFKSQLDHFRVQLDQSNSRLDQVIGLLAESQQEDLAIDIVTPRDHKPGKPVREANKPYTISGISGTARGNVGSAYIILRSLPTGEPRLSNRLELTGGYWESSVSIPSREKKTEFEIYAFAIPEKTDFPLGGRITLPESHVKSNSIKVRVKFIGQLS